MKLINKWTDNRYRADNYIYETASGLKVIHTLNDKMLETYISIGIYAGTYFEKELNVPNGTAHFLEHMLFKPNKEFKSIKEIDAFEFGNKERAKIVVNAETGFRWMTFYGLTHFSRENDLLKRLSTLLTYPTSLFPKYIEEERKVILAEYQHDLKPEKDPYLQFTNFALKGKIYNDSFPILGANEECIKSIKNEHIQTFYNSQFVPKNTFISIQSPTPLSKEFESWVNEISTAFERNLSKTQIFPESLQNEKKDGYFFNDNLVGINTYLFRFRNFDKKKRDYLRDLLSDFTVELIRYLSMDELREKKGLIYDLSGFSTGFYTWNYVIEGYKMTTDLHNLKEAIEGLDQIIYEKSIKFLKTKHGKNWLENAISKFVYPKTMGHIPNFAENIGYAVLRGYELYNFEKAKEIAITITPSLLINFMKKENKELNYSFWFDSGESTEKVKAVFEMCQTH